MTRWALLAGILTGCLSGISDNADGVNSIEIRLPTNFYLEANRPLTLSAVARNGAGDSVAAAFRWTSPDSTIAVDSSLGIVTALVATGKARVQLALLGKDSLFSSLDNLSFTLTAPADTTALTIADSLDAVFDTSSTTIAAIIQGGSPRTPVAGRPITFTIIDPVVDTPVVAFPNTRAADSVLTGPTGVSTIVVRGRTGKTIPDRVVVEVSAYRASGQKIPGSGRRVVIRFRHQTP